MGINLGWLCMSWRQPENTDTADNARSTRRTCAGDLIRHLRNQFRMVPFQKLAGITQAEMRVLRFNAQEEFVTAGTGEIGSIENRMVRLRQSIQRQHAKHTGQ